MYMLSVRTYDNHALVAVGVDQYGRQGETQLLGSAHVLVVCALYPRSMGHDLLDQNRTGILTGDSTTIAKSTIVTTTNTTNYYYYFNYYYHFYNYNYLKYFYYYYNYHYHYCNYYRNR